MDSLSHLGYSITTFCLSRLKIGFVLIFCVLQIGEGTFGEVFILPTSELDDPPVVKIVPVEGNTLVNGQPQTKLKDMLAEM